MQIAILVVSIIFQFIAAVLSVHLIFVTRKMRAWLLIALAMTLMGIRRSVTLYLSISSGIAYSADLYTEIIALTISILMVAGLLFIRPIFKNIQTTNDTLRASEEKYREMVDFFPQSFYEADRQGNVIFSNKSGHDIFGEIPNDTNKTSNIIEHIVPEDRERGKKNMQRVLQGEHIEPNEYKMFKKNGSIFPALIYSSPISNAGKIIGIRGLVMDLSEHVQSEEKLSATASLLNNVINTSQDFIFVKDTQLRTLLCNNAFAQTVGKKPEELYGKTDIENGWSPELVLGNQEKGIRGYANDDQAALEGKIVHNTLDLVKNNGEPRYFDTLKTPLRDSKGNIIGVLGVARDITEQKLAVDKLVESEEKYRTLIESSPYCIHQIDFNGKIISMNRAGLSMIGLKDENEIIGVPYIDLVCATDRKPIKKLMEFAFKGDFYDFEFSSNNGRIFQSNFVPVLRNNKEINCLLGITQDITERKKSENEIRKLSLSVEHSPNIVMITDNNAIIEYVNPIFTKITGYTYEEAIGKKPTEFISEEIDINIFRGVRELINTGKDWNGEFICKKKNGDTYLSSQTIFPIKNQDGVITHVVSIHKDITEEKKLSDRLSYHASHDDLTGLVNRREFERRAENLISNINQSNNEHALCLIDLDQFKVVNDTCGHIAGDELLRQLSLILKNTVRKHDTLARLGGDEFGVLMENCSIDGAQRVAKSLQKAINSYQFSWKGRNFMVRASMGLVLIKEHIHDLNTLMRNADAACYMAKEKGRNRIHVYHSDDTELAKRHGEMQWVTRLYKALEEDQFCLYAQAIAPLSNHPTKHYELLVRMIDEQGNHIPPGAFLPAAERYNLILKVDCWVFEKAISLLIENSEFINQVHFCSINLSGQSITEQKFLDFVITKLNASGLDGSKICFEITETATISNLSAAIRFISTLKGLGCKFALDDFGSGLSSFGYLKNLPVDYLKIDGMFVKDIVNDSIDHSMVKTINELGHVMGMKTIAEFVENDEIKGMLREIGIDYAQGYGIDKPQLFDDLLKKKSKIINFKSGSSI